MNEALQVTRCNCDHCKGDGRRFRTCPINHENMLLEKFSLIKEGEIKHFFNKEHYAANKQYCEPFIFKGDEAKQLFKKLTRVCCPCLNPNDHKLLSGQMMDQAFGQHVLEFVILGSEEVFYDYKVGSNDNLQLISGKKGTSLLRFCISSYKSQSGAFIANKRGENNIILPYSCDSNNSKILVVSAYPTVSFGIASTSRWMNNKKELWAKSENGYDTRKKATFSTKFCVDDFDYLCYSNIYIDDKESLNRKIQNRLKDIPRELLEMEE